MRNALCVRGGCLYFARKGGKEGGAGDYGRSFDGSCSDDCFLER